MNYTLEQKNNFYKKIASVCNQLWNIAKQNNQKIFTIGYKHDNATCGTMFDLLWCQNIKGVDVEGCVSEYGPLMKNR